MSSEFEGPRTAIVTGGAMRIGAAICRALSADGWHLLIHCRTSQAEAAQLAEELGDARAVTADLAAPDAADTIFEVLDGMPPLRLLVNNASRFIYDSPDDFTAEGWDEHLTVNLRAPVLLCRKFAQSVDEAGGVIVNLLDAKLAHPNSDFFSYTVSKLGLGAVTDLLARAYAARRIRICGIAPSVTLQSGRQSLDNFDAVHRLNPLGRGVTVDDVIRALRFIVETPTLTGQTIILDGGQRFLGLGRDVQFLEQQ